MSQFPEYDARLEGLKRQLATVERPFKLSKKTTSNLFRYKASRGEKFNNLSLKAFNHVLGLDRNKAILQVEGLATYETIVGYALNHGFIPTVSPELKHITVGGAIVGIGIESSSFRYGFVHDGLIEADVLLHSGEVVTCNAKNEFSDLFHGLPNSYGTLGYILRAKIRLVPAKPLVSIENERFTGISSYLEALADAADDARLDFVEGLFYSRDELYLTKGRMVDHAAKVFDIYGPNIYYKELRKSNELSLKTGDYIFRFDPDWFWNIPEKGMQFWLLRNLAPRSMRSSKFYNWYVAKKKALGGRFGDSDRTTAPLIQDWEVPWEKARDLVEFALKTVDLGGRPWVALPIKPLSSPTVYPVKAGKLYFNLGCYCHVDKTPERENFEDTILIDSECINLNGLKMLYSSSFFTREQFDDIYNGIDYKKLRNKYDPESYSSNLYQKSVLR